MIGHIDIPFLHHRVGLLQPKSLEDHSLYGEYFPMLMLEDNFVVLAIDDAGQWVLEIAAARGRVDDKREGVGGFGEGLGIKTHYFGC